MDRGTVIRTIVLFLVLINQFLVSAGLNPIPGTEEQWGEIVSVIITAAVAIWAWFKNNYITSKGKTAKGSIEKRRFDEMI